MQTYLYSYVCCFKSEFRHSILHLNVLCDSLEICFRVKSRRTFVGPNAGFEAQLQLFERMGFTIDSSNLQYRIYRLKLAAEKVKKGNKLILKKSAEML